MNIALMGYRGSGKSTVGRLVAHRLGLGFVDCDVDVCRQFGGLTIRQIWQEHGEAEFRRMECRVLRDLLQSDGQVIALGGGTPVQPEAQAAMRQAQSLVKVYLRSSAEELWKRISGDAQTAATRPSLTGLGGGLDEVRSVLAQREPTYLALADHVVDVAGHTPEQNVEQVLQVLGLPPRHQGHQEDMKP